MFDQLVVGHRVAVDDERSLRVERFAGRHVAAHEGHQLFVVETLQTGRLRRPKGLNVCSGERLQVDRIP